MPTQLQIVFVPEEKLTECESDRSFPASVPLEM
jgi:hypothetical protein